MKKPRKELVVELKTMRLAADAALKKLTRLVEQVEGEVHGNELRLEANQRTMRLMIALSALIDEAGEKRQVFWEHGLVSREQYDAIAWEFHRIGIPARLDGCRWTERHQSSEALLSILDEYRKEHGR